MNYVFARLMILLLAISGLTVALILGGAAWKPTSDELGDAGELLTWTNQILTLLNVLIGLRILGLLTVYGFLTPQARNLLSRQGRDVIIQVSKFSLLWAVVSFCTAVTTMGTVLGTNFSQTLAPGTIPTYIWEIPPSRSLLIVCLLALMISAISAVTTSLNSVALLAGLATIAVAYPLLNSHSSALGNHSLAITATATHGVAMSLWVGALIAMWPFIKYENTDVVRRYSTLATWCVVALLISGIISAATRMESVRDVYQSGYGFLVLCKVLLFGTIAYCAILVRKSLAQTGQAAMFVLWELFTMAVATGVGVALHFTKPSKVSNPVDVPSTEILGFPIPPAPSAPNYIFGWHPEWFMLTATMIGASLYTLGLIRLKQNRIRWPILRSVSFFFGIGFVMWATCAGIAKYAMVSFSAHMIQHMTLSMLAPIFIVLSAPITLALRALPSASSSNHRNARGWILGILHSRYATVVTQPFFALFVFTVGLYGIYFTSLFSTLMASHSGHIFMEIHFLLTGLLFSFVVIGVDPAPRKIPYWGKLLLVLVALSVHAFFAIAIMQSTTPLGNEWYSQVRPEWIDNPLTDTYTAGGIAWALGEVPTLLLMVIVAVQWARSDTRKAVQLDRAAERDGDAELNEYNNKLAWLNDRDGK